MKPSDIEYPKLISDRSNYGSAVLVIAIICLIGGLSLHETFSGDQALFSVYSRAIDNGAVLYKDLWDMKQPGIFIFYLLAGKLFGFSEFGVHLLELIYLCSLALIMVAALRNYFTRPIFAILTPLFTIGIYYSVSESWHLTQVEALVCFPLFMSLWLCQKYVGSPTQKKFLFLSGVFGGIVVLFKLMFVGILFCIWAGLLIFCYLRYRTQIKQMFAMAGLIVMGLTIPIAIVALYFAYNDAFSTFWYTTFIYPVNAAISVNGGDRSQIFKDGVIWFLKSYFPVIVLTSIFLILKVKYLFTNRRNINLRDIDPKTYLFVGLAMWVFSGLVVILVQRLSWWEYHYSLLMLPLGILAVKGLEGLFQAIATKTTGTWKTLGQISFVVIILLLFAPTARRLGHRISLYGQMETVTIGHKQQQITGNIDGYKAIAADAKFLAQEAEPPKIFALSNPLYYYFSDLSPAISIDGWMPDLFTDVEWNRLDREMTEKKPKYIFMENRLPQLIQSVHPAFLVILDKNYSIYRTSEAGIIYKLNEQGS